MRNQARLIRAERMRLLAIIVLTLSLPGAAFAQTAGEAQLGLRIQQLEEQIRFLTGENERLTHELMTLRGQGGAPASPDLTGADTGQPLPAQPIRQQDSERLQRTSARFR